MGNVLGAILSGLADCLWGTSAKEEAVRRPSEQQRLRPQKDDIYVQPVVPHKPYIVPGTGAFTHEYQPVPVAQPQPPARRPSPPERGQAQANAQNPHYTSLRAQAKEAAAQMARSFEESHTAYAGGDGARAKELSNEGKEHQREMEELNAQASEWIFTENNKGREPGEVDLHGLFVKEATTFTDRAIRGARNRGVAKLHLIVGKGLHSQNGVAKLKPAIEELIQKNGLIAESDQSNEGVLIVNLDGQPSGEGRVTQPDDIAHGLERRDKGCTIM